jgi:hypothetical protein
MGIITGTCERTAPDVSITALASAKYRCCDARRASSTPRAPRSCRYSPPSNLKAKRDDVVRAVSPFLRAGATETSVNLPSATSTGTPRIWSIGFDQEPPLTVARRTTRPAHTHVTPTGQRLSSITRSGRTCGPPTAAVWPMPTGPSIAGAAVHAGVSDARATKIAWRRAVICSA